MMFRILFWFRKGYVRIISALTSLLVGPWTGFQIFALVHTFDVSGLVATILCCGLFVLSIGLIAFPEKLVSGPDDKSWKTLGTELFIKACPKETR